MMTHSPPPPPPPRPSDAYTFALARLVGALCEDAIFAMAAAGRGHPAALDGLGKRRTDAYTAVLQGTPVPRMTDDFDRWVIELSRAIAPVAPPAWMPMADVIGEKVTLEVGARGIRSLFSSKPSDKDVQRVKRLGTLATRLLRAVFAADGPVDAEEARTLASFVASLGLPEAEAAPLLTEAPVAIDQLDIYGDLDPGIGRALVVGAWHAAAWDAIDPREETVIRTFAKKISLPAEELERARAEAIHRVDVRRAAGIAAVDAVRFMLSDRAPGLGVQLAAKAGTLMLPRRYREEALAQVGHGAPVTLARRHTGATPEDKFAVLAMAWAASLYEDPTMARRALLRARHDRIAQDLGDDGQRARLMIDAWISEVLLPVAFNMT
jgi:hypothetical protein